MVNSKLAATALGALLGFFVAMAPLGAVEYNRSTTVMFSGPFGLPGITLGSGTYVFELAVPSSSQNLVRVMNGDRTRIMFTAFTDLVERPKGLPDDRPFTFYENKPDVAPRIDAWYPRGEHTGHRFHYSHR